MKTFKIFLAAIVIMLASNLLSGCSTSEISMEELSRLSMARIEAAREHRKSVQIMLEKVPAQKGLVLDLKLFNPENKPLNSAEMWLAYNPAHLKGAKFQANESAFDLTAPYVNGFDQDAGLFKFGRATANSISDSTITLGRLYFEKLAHETSFLDAYDYVHDLSGHHSVNMMVDGEPVNILMKPASPLFVSEKSNQ